MHAPPVMVRSTSACARGRMRGNGADPFPRVVRTPLRARGSGEAHPAMATVDPRADQPNTPAAPARRRNPWPWLCALLALVAAGLLIWALTVRSDLDSTQKELDSTKQDVSELQAQVQKGQDTGGTIVTAFKAAYDALAQQLGSTSEDLANAQQGIDAAKQQADSAGQDAAQAKQDAADAKNATDKATAAADQAKAELQGAQSKATIAADCA